ncbi:signal transduction histidine kinase [Bacilli bacterium PM5-3]|nr:signal transduction histidine kinase [Bacilli bacterium PM5-3]MDH6604328.1 signal transduction histidine kinase [Bacilli bacterium PM5-9]
MKDKLSKSWRIIFAIIIAIYIIVVIFFAYSIVNIPKNYSQVQTSQTNKVKSELENAIDLNQQNFFRDLEDKYAIEFVVMDNNKNIIYSTIPITKNTDFKNSLSENAVSYEEYYEYKNNNSVYSVWLLEYYLSPQSTFDAWSFSLFISVAVLVSLNFIVVVILFSKFIKPLERLRDNIYKLSQYQLNLIDTNNKTEYDQISKKLVHFAKDLEGYIDNSTIEYTTLEKNLQIQNEKLEYKNKLVASMTHDLKGAVNIIALQTDTMLETTSNNTIKDINKSSKKLITDINEISNIIYKDEYSMDLIEIDVTNVVLNILEKYTIQLERKNIDVEVIADDIIKVKTNKYSIVQIIDNAISNIVMYAKENSDAVIELDLNHNRLNLSFYNESNEFSEVELKSVFKLFFRRSNDKLGTGTGLYTVKRLVEELQGTVNFINKDKGVELQIEVVVE